MCRNVIIGMPVIARGNGLGAPEIAHGMGTLVMQVVTGRMTEIARRGDNE